MNNLAHPMPAKNLSSISRSTFLKHQRYHLHNIVIALWSVWQGQFRIFQLGIFLSALQPVIWGYQYVLILYNTHLYWQNGKETYVYIGYLGHTKSLTTPTCCVGFAICYMNICLIDNICDTSKKMMFTFLYDIVQVISSLFDLFCQKCK